MTFTALVKSFPAKKIAALTDAEVRTVYAWRRGDRSPPRWRHPHIVRAIKLELSKSRSKRSAK